MSGVPGVGGELLFRIWDPDGTFEVECFTDGSMRYTGRFKQNLKVSNYFPAILSREIALERQRNSPQPE